MADTAKYVLKGVIARLLSQSGVTSLVSTRVYSWVPQDTTFPCVKVSIIESRPDNTFSATEYTHKVRVQCFSRATTPKEVLDIREAVFNALNRKDANITLDSGTLVGILASDLSSYFLEDDGKTFQGVIDFSVSVN